MPLPCVEENRCGDSWRTPTTLGDPRAVIRSATTSTNSVVAAGRTERNARHSSSAAARIGQIGECLNSITRRLLRDAGAEVIETVSTVSAHHPPWPTRIHPARAPMHLGTHPFASAISTGDAANCPCAAAAAPQSIIRTPARPSGTTAPHALHRDALRVSPSGSPLFAKFITSMPWWQTDVNTLHEMHFLVAKSRNLLKRA